VSALAAARPDACRRRGSPAVLGGTKSADDHGNGGAGWPFVLVRSTSGVIGSGFFLGRDRQGAGPPAARAAAGRGLGEKGSGRRVEAWGTRMRYVDLISRIALAVMDACFRALDAALVDMLTLNGHVPTIDPATGRPDRPCVITVTASRSTFEELALDNERLSPSKCLTALGAEMSPHPYELESIKPFVDFDLKQYRIVTAPEALVALDSNDDLLKMNAYKFERLVKDLFTKMGHETWRTTSSRDDGIDAIATKSDPIFPVECVIQAKRVAEAVPPKDVQALMGAMAEHGTATHGVLVTTSWLSDRSRQRARAQRIITIEHGELLYLIQEHLNRKVVISNRPPPR
jgi:restriction system protein